MYLISRLRPTLLAAFLLPLVSVAQTPAPAPSPTTPPPSAQSQQWFLQDIQTDGAVGISAQRAYQELLKNRTPTPVIVAVIDGGIDTAHQDLRRVLWKNPKEVAGNGKDDDHNGYVDDVYGWNFLGGKDGRNVGLDTYEDTRLMAKLQPLYEGKNRASLSAAKQAEYDLYQRVKKDYEQKLKDDSEHAQQYAPMSENFANITGQLKQLLKVEKVDTALLRKLPTDDPSVRQMSQAIYQYLVAIGAPDMDTAVQQLKDATRDAQDRVNYSLNLKYNPRTIVGDNPEKTKDRAYGNTDVTGPDPLHGTHVAGIIGADRTNELGGMGVAADVRIMSIRAVPNGDEHDKDVANAIRYAADNGAQIINMSFGKYYSPQRPAVEDAIRYAGNKGVLLVHSAGNESKDLDVETQYPSPRFLDGKTIPNMITVGASGRTNDEKLAADFSNYGKRTVDVFAPGVNIYSTLPGNKYGNESGTSMAGPVVSGIAAVLKSYFPKLTPTDLKRLIQQSAIPYHTSVLKPGGKEQVPFDQLSNTGGVVNLYRAIELAQQP